MFPEESWFTKESWLHEESWFPEKSWRHRTSNIFVLLSSELRSSLLFPPCCLAGAYRRSDGTDILHL